MSEKIKVHNVMVYNLSNVYVYMSVYVICRQPKAERFRPPVGDGNT